MVRRMAFRRSALYLFLSLFCVNPQMIAAQTTTASAVSSLANNVIVLESVYTPLTVTGQFPCLTENSYMILTDSQSSSATYPVWTCTSDCGGMSSGVGLMVFPATTTTGIYEVQNPPSGYPALEISNFAVITDSTFSTLTSVYVHESLATITSIFTYPSFPGLSLTIETTTPILAALATPVAVPVNCQSGTSASRPVSASVTASSPSQASIASTHPLFSSGQAESSNPMSASKNGATSTKLGDLYTSAAASSASTLSSSSAASGSWHSPASNYASVSASISSGAQVLPRGATVITSTLVPSGSITTSRVISETFIPTTYSTLTGLTSTLTTSSIISYGTSTTAILITVYPGESAWGLPSVEPGTPIFPAPSVAPNEGLQWSSRGQSSSSTHNASSGFTTNFTSGTWANDLPTSLTAEPPPLDNPPASSLVAGLTVFSGTTSPTIEYISTGVSSDTHSPTDHAKAFPIFWGHSHFCFLFCPLHGTCLFCGFIVDLLPGIYPPGSIKFPPDWTEPDITITVEEDGTPIYDEDEEPTTTSTTTTSTTSSTTSTPSSATISTSQSLKTSVSRSSSASSSTVSSDDFLCDSTCSSCANIDPPSGTPPPKAKRYLQGDNAPIRKRILPDPQDWPWRGDMDLFTWDQWQNKVINTVLLRRNYHPLSKHVSSSLFHFLGDFTVDLAVAGLYGCTSLVVVSTQGVWMSHFWEVPSFHAGSPIPRRLTAAQQQLLFERQVLDVLGPGDGTPDFPGLLQYIGIGKDFGPNTQIQAAIISPRYRHNPQAGVFLYWDMVQQIAKNVTQMFGGDWDAHTIGSMVAPVDYIDYTPRPDQHSQEWTAAGKAIFQYDPVQRRCIDNTTGLRKQYAASQMWFENFPDSYLYAEWQALPAQLVPATPTPEFPSKRRALGSNDTIDEQDQVHLNTRQGAWSPDMQPVVYPACSGAIRNSRTNTPESTAVLASSSAPSGPGFTTLSLLLPSPTSSSTISSAPAAPPVESRIPLTCLNGESFTSKAKCTDWCFAGNCLEYGDKRMGKIKERCVDCIPEPIWEAWLCECNEFLHETRL